MELLHDLGEESTHALLQNVYEFLLGLYVSFAGHELLVHSCEYPLMLLEVKVLDASVDHQMKQIQYQSLIVSKVQERLHALGLEQLILGILVASHALDHLLADSDGRR